MNPASLTVEARDGRARAGSVTLLRGSFRTPCFMPVGTRGAIKLLDADDLDDLQPDVVLANAYHLMLRPGAETVAAFGGLPGFTGWSGLFLTDSGGYQVFSLRARTDDEGVTFHSTYDGSEHRLTPEDAVAVQELLGADIQMALDVCARLPAPEPVIRVAAERTLAWAARARQAHARSDQSLFGIVQGGTSPEMRAEFAAQTAALDFDGYAVGGLSVGEPRSAMIPALAAALEELPPNRPRYLMGVGDPMSILDAVALGVDMFDCVLPTRLARHGAGLSDGGRVQVRAAGKALDDRPIDPTCSCRVCRRYSVGYVRHLLAVSEPTGGRLLTLHNLSWMLGFIERVRQAISAGQLMTLKDEVAAGWGEEALR